MSTTPAIFSTAYSAYQTNVSNSSATSKGQTSTNGIETNTEQQTNPTVELSTRAQKIQALGEEFFPGGAKTIVISESFIERLQ